MTGLICSRRQCLVLVTSVWPCPTCIDTDYKKCWRPLEYVQCTNSHLSTSQYSLKGFLRYSQNNRTALLYRIHSANNCEPCQYCKSSLHTQCLSLLASPSNKSHHAFQMDFASDPCGSPAHRFRYATSIFFRSCLRFKSNFCSL